MARGEEEEVVEEGAEEAQPAATEFVPEASAKPKSNVYTAILILSFCAFLAGCIISGREAWEHYDVQFWMFTKPPPKATGTSDTGTGTTEAPPPAKDASKDAMPAPDPKK